MSCAIVNPLFTAHHFLVLVIVNGDYFCITLLDYAGNL